MLKLNLASHGEEIPGYISVDFDHPEAQVKADVCELPYADNSVDELLAYHILEHMRATNDYEPHLSNPLNKHTVLEALLEWKRVLKPGGILYIKVPDFEKIVWLYCNFPQWAKAAGPGGIFSNYTFWLNSVGQHQAVFDIDIMVECLKQAGFTDIMRIDGPPQAFVDRANLEMCIKVIKHD